MAAVPQGLVCFEVPQDLAREVKRLTDPRRRLAALTTYFDKSAETGHAAGTYPAVDQDIWDHWHDEFARARESLGGLDRPDAAGHLKQAADIVAEAHRAPPPIRATGREGVAAGRYSRWHEDVVHLVAESIALDESGLAPSSAEHPARRLSIQLRDAFGTGARSGIRAGARLSEILPSGSGPVASTSARGRTDEPDSTLVTTPRAAVPVPPPHVPGSPLPPIPEERIAAALAPLAAAVPRRVPIAQDLDTRRPPRLDRDLPAAPVTTGPVRFSDSARLPLYMSGGVASRLPGLPQDVVQRSFSFGQSARALRGTELVVEELGRALSGSAGIRPVSEESGFGLLDAIDAGLRAGPQSFFGDGRRFVYRTAGRKTRTLHVTARPYGQWERFTFGAGKPVKIDTMQRSTATSGEMKVNSTSLALAPTAPLGPLKHVVTVWGRVFMQVAIGKQAQYNLRNQVVNQTETRTTDGSHAHLDDVWYEFSLTDRSGRPVGPDGEIVLAGDPSRTPLAFGFAVRDGLMVRLADSITVPRTPQKPMPERLALGPGSRFRMANTEAYGPVAHIRDWALRQIDVKEGTAAAVLLDDFFSSDSFQRMGRALNNGPAYTPMLSRGQAGGDPAGVFSVRVQSGDAVLINETTAAELRDIAQSTVRNERLIRSTLGAEVGGSAGPGFQLFGLEDGAFDLRLLAGVSLRYGASRSRGSVFGGSGAVKSAAQAKGAATGLYLVQKTVTVTAPPDTRAALPEARGHGAVQRGRLRKNSPQKWSEAPRTETFQTWAVERLTRTEALRLDGLGTGVVPGGAEPVPPPWLAADEPPTLGMSRVEEFTFADGSLTREIDGRPVTFAEHFADAVLRRIGTVYPDLVAPLDELNPRNPRWRHAGHFETVVSNTLEVLNTLSHQGMASGLETMASTGMRFGLVDSGALTRGHRYVWVDASLTGRRYEGKQEDLRLRHSAPGSENLGGRQGGTRGVQAGVEGLLSGRDTDRDRVGRPRSSATASVGVRVGRRTESESGYGHGATHEAMSVGTGGSHLHSYELTLTAEAGGFWRPRRWMRGLLSMNVLGTQPFVFTDRPTALIEPPGAGAERSAAPGVGRVLLSLPVEHTPEAAPASSVAPEPAQAIPFAEARDLVLATPEFLAGLTGRGASPLSEHPHQTVSVTAHEMLTAAAERALEEASGGSWLVTLKGAPAYDAAARVFEGRSLTANFDQSSAPAGWRATSLWSQAPYLDRTTALAHRTTLGADMAAVTGAVKIETETTLGGLTEAAGRANRTSTLFLGGQVAYLNSHRVGSGVTGSYALVASPFRLDTSRSVSVSRSAVAEINRKDTGRQVVVTASVAHEVAAVSSRIGERATGSRSVPASLAGAAGRRIELDRGWVGHVPEKSAYRLGLLKDGFGDVPLYTGRSWSPLPWLRDHPFGSWAVNSLDTSAALRQFEEELRPLGLSSADRDQLRRLVSDRVVRAIGKEMTGAGSSVPARIGRWGSQTAQVWIGERQVRLRAELIPVEERTDGFRGMGHSVELEEHRQALEGVQQGRGRTSGATLGIGVSEGAHVGDGTVRNAGPTYSQSGSALRSVTQSTHEGTVRISTATTTQAHGEYATRYRIRLTLDVTDTGQADPSRAPQKRAGLVGEQFDRSWRKLIGRRQLTVSAEADAGRLIEHFPMSLMRPDPSEPLAYDPLAPAVPMVDAGPRRVDVPQSLGTGGWHDVRHPGAGGELKPFELPGEGFAVRRIMGLDQLHTATTVALGAAYDASLLVPKGADLGDDVLRRAKDTPLTRSGTGSAQSLEDGTSNGALTAFYGRTLTPDGYAVAGLTDRGLFGGADGSLTVYSRPDLRAARLLTVADGMKFEAPEREIHGGGSSASQQGVSEQLLAAGPTTSAVSTGTTQSGTGSGAQEGDWVVMGVSGERLGSVNVKPEKDRAFLFAVPTTWLSLAAVRHHVKDSTVGSAFRSVFGNTDRTPQALETDATVLAWVREDVARDLGLIDDVRFPPEVAGAWDAVTKADKAWTTADTVYWDLRRGEGRRLEASVREAAALDSGGSEHAAALTRLESFRDTLQDRLAFAEAVAEEYARVREGADRLTRWHELAATEEGRRLLGDTPRPAAVTFRAPHSASAESSTAQTAATGARTADTATAATVAPAAKTTNAGTESGASRSEAPRTGTAKSGAAKSETARPEASDTARAEHGAGVRPAHALPPWQQREDGPDRRLRHYDAATDHRTLTAVDPGGRSWVLDLHRPAGDGNGFYAAVERAGDGRLGITAGQLASAVSRSADVPVHATLDPLAVFHPHEVEPLLGTRPQDREVLTREITANGGRLPESVRTGLTPEQRHRLVGLNLRTARRWDADTADLAASLTARALGVDLTVVQEDGSHRLHPGAASEPPVARRQVTVYRRAGSYLAAVPRQDAPLTAPAESGTYARPETVHPALGEAASHAAAPEVHETPQRVHEAVHEAGVVAPHHGTTSGPAESAADARRREIREGKRPERAETEAAGTGMREPAGTGAAPETRGRAQQQERTVEASGSGTRPLALDDERTGPEVSLDVMFGPAVAPKTVKRSEQDDAVSPQVRLNPLWYPLEDFRPALLDRGGVWLYAIDQDGRFFLGSEDVWSIAGEEERQRLLAAMRTTRPGLTMQELRGVLNDQGVPTVAAGFDEAGATVVGPARVGGELFRDPLTGRWTIDASSRYVGPAVRPGVEAADVTRWVRNAAEVLSSALGITVLAKDAERPTIAHGAFVAGTGTQELDHAYGPLAGPKKVKDRERDAQDSAQVRLNPLWYRLEEFKPALLDRTDGVWHYAVDEEGEISIGSDQVLSIMAEDELDELWSAMRRADPDLTREQLRAAIDNQGHPTVAAGFRTDGSTVVRPARISGELSYDPVARSWQLTDKSGRYMSNKIRPSLSPEDGLRWLANTARRIAEQVGVPVTPVLFKNASGAPATVPPAPVLAEETGPVVPAQVDLLDPAVFLERSGSAGPELRSLSRVAGLDRLLNEYRGTGDHEGERRVELLDTLADRARIYAATTKNEQRREVVVQLAEQAGAMAAELRARVSAPGAAVATEEAAGVADGASVGPLVGTESERDRIARAKRVWQGPVAEQAQQLEQRLLDAGPGARSLVLGVLPDEPLWAVNTARTVRWMEHSTGRLTRTPQSAVGRVESIDLDPRSRLIGSASEAGTGAQFCGLTLGSDLTHVM
ncbi:hypothetical protein OHT61_31340 [Streptomyces sp. NBC_00178]|uniref:hypothetical protein n=1 Tax=Streptomyces sp. NBC_00178 TaxID=2975672 RepID=UPI002E29CD33|nr:hypothetical protein [Streptomyces sp. NBC_00178]